MLALQDRADKHFFHKKVDVYKRPTVLFKESCSQSRFLVCQEGFSFLDNDEIKTVPCTINFLTIGFYTYVEVLCDTLESGSKVFCAHFVSAGSCRKSFSGTLTFFCEKEILNSYDFSLVCSKVDNSFICFSWGKYGFAEFTEAEVPANEFSGGSGKWKVNG